MDNGAIGDYIEKDYQGHDVFIPDQAYSAALDALVIACTDIFMVVEGKVLLGKRMRYPQADWWLFGGRMKTGESLAESSSRLLRIEAGLGIAPERFSYLTTFATAWKMRAHEPQENGTHTVSLVMVVELTLEESSHVIVNDEYSDKKLVNLTELVDASAYHPALGQCARAYQNR